jgi:hypothetical protein
LYSSLSLPSISSAVGPPPLWNTTIGIGGKPISRAVHGMQHPEGGAMHTLLVERHLRNDTTLAR